MLLLLYHLQCQALAPDALRDPGLDPSWLRCDSSAVGLGFSSALLLFLGLTASAALELRFRIQKTGKRSLNWNVKPQRWKERNIRRGASAALRALTKNEAGEDMAALQAESAALLLPRLATPPGRLGGLAGNCRLRAAPRTLAEQLCRSGPNGRLRHGHQPRPAWWPLRR